MKLSSIGKSFQGRDIQLLTVDARDKLKGKDEQLNDKPAILITGQHHSREVITSSMVLFSVLKLLHGGMVHNEQRYANLLKQNKYYVIPTVNVDGLNFIEEKYKETGKIIPKRTNMNVRIDLKKEMEANDKCHEELGGVDLNRNYGFKFGVGSSSDKECTGDDYRGPSAFSEPETQAMKKFLIEK